MKKLDVRGKVCPLPLFYAKRKISEMEPGRELEITIDDPTAKETIPEWVRIHGHEVVRIEDEKGFTRIIVRKRK
ncbi:MAG TPA: sulfurtransferase TusA family protein [Candidatus Methanoperedens sp.]